MAGAAALVAGLGFLFQPLLVFLLPAPDGSEWWPPDRMPELAPRIIAAAVVWCVFSAAKLILVVAVLRLTRPAVLPLTGALFGAIGGAAWLAESAVRITPLSMPAEHLATAPVDPGTQATVLYGLTLLSYALTVLGGLGDGVWWITVGITSRGLLGRAISVSAVVVGVLCVLTAFTPLPIGIALSPVLCVVLGAVLLHTVRRDPPDRVTHGATDA